MRRPTATQFLKNNITRANRLFRKMTRRRRAVRVAADAIWQVTVGSFVPGDGYLDMAGTHCEGCAKAGLFAGLLDHKPALTSTFKCLEEEDLTRKMVPDIFTQKTWDDIEQAYEGWYQCPDYTTGRNKETFLRICTNIIHNRGEFVPDKDAPKAKHNALIRRYSATKLQIRKLQCTLRANAHSF